jgi:hypothetical protein
MTDVISRELKNAVFWGVALLQADVSVELVACLQIRGNNTSVIRLLTDY